MTRRDLRRSTALASGKVDPDQQPMAVLDIRSLPQIDAEALPGLPLGMVAYLRGGDPPMILLYDPVADMHVAVPLALRHDLTPYLAALREAQARQAMGEAPEAQGYRIEVGR
jgi:hypothetical protein